MISFFKEKSTVAVIGLIIVSTVIRAFFWRQSPGIVTTESDGFIYYLLSPLAFLSGIALTFLYHFIVVFQALRLNYILNDARLFPRPAFTTALAYIVLTALLPAWNNITSALIVNSMLIWLLSRLIKLQSTQQPKTLVYNIGLITGITILLYFPACFLVPVIFFALASFRPFRPNEWTVLLLGILTPFYFLTGWLFLNDKLDLVIHQLEIFRLHIIRPSSILFAIITFSIAGVAIAAGILMWQSNINRMAIQVRKHWSVLFIMLILLLPAIYLIDNAWPDALLLAAIPAATFVSNAFLYPKRNLGPALLFWILVALVIYNNWVIAKI
ncbi:MAG TPA: DUF6427 family protein [Chitinophagaceae bacterium]